ncbi:FMN-dependent oxidoreductase (nitrilotriacetate monooxygenase family) [Roseovarius sp. MBR-78]|uniref:LLM class flavin-dependent oxidoreductase n=1 Tax=Roseovarius sp. MBR-78 TaxID=3156460 RepID=UPI0033924065
MTQRLMHLGAFLYPTGHHVAAWRHPDGQPDAGVNIAHYRHLAQVAERGLFDLLFLADGVGIRGDDLPALSRTAIRYVGQFEPITLLSALSAVTTHIGLVATVSTTYSDPYTIARKFASLDHLSGGRAGWNLVTSADDFEARNFGLDHQMAHAARYARAEEAVDVVARLWDSWPDDAFPRDKASGQFFRPEAFAPIHHKGPHFNVRGPLNVPRSPQGRPVIFQAGASEPGKALAARTADAVFTATQTVAEGQDYYSDLKQRLPAHSRDPHAIKVMPGVFPVIGRSRTEAEDKFAQLQDLVHPDVALSHLSNLLGTDVSAFDPHGPLPDLPVSAGHVSRQKLLIDRARRDNLSVLDLALSMAGARGHWQITGTAQDIADALQERFETGAADGFNIMGPVLPGGLEDFVDLVIPTA